MKALELVLRGDTWTTGKWKRSAAVIRPSEYVLERTRPLISCGKVVVDDISANLESSIDSI